MNGYLSANNRNCSFIDSILQKFLKIQNGKRIPNDLNYRHEIGDITKEFPQYEVGTESGVDR